MLPVLVSTLGFCAIWFLAGLVIPLISRKAVEASSKGEGSRSLPLLQFLDLGHLFVLPIAWGYFLAHGGENALLKAETSGEAASILVLAIGLPVAFAGIVYMAVRVHTDASWGHLTSNRRDKAQLGGQFLVLGLLLAAVVAATSTFTSQIVWYQQLRIPALVVPIIAAILMSFITQRGVSGTAPAKPAEMEESPLQAELSAISDRFVNLKQPWKITPVKRRGGSEDITPMNLSQIANGWWISFRPKTPSLPLILLQNLDPDTISCLVALIYSRICAPRKAPIIERLVRVAPFRMVFFIFFGIMLGTLAWTSTGNHHVSAIGFGISAVLFLALLGSKLGVLPGDREAYRRAFDIWRELGDPEKRTGEHFVFSLWDYDRLILHTFAEDRLARHMLANRNLTSFIDTLPADEREHIIARLREIEKGNKGSAAGTESPAAE